MVNEAMSKTPAEQREVSIEDLPDEVLEFILSFLPPYKDLHDCMCVSKRWRRCVLNVTKAKSRNLVKAILDFDIDWKTITPAAMAPTITKRYSHAATIHDNSMYVFGGCTCSMTTFNDLWRLDLSKRQWVRPLAMGTYPSPKACSTMVCYKDSLVLFGGWTCPPSYPLHQSWHLFNELHMYDITANRWTCINTQITPPPTAGHSVSVHGKWMVIFGGLQRGSNVVHSTKTNDIWKLNLETWNWYKQETKGTKKPEARYGQSQTVIDDEHLLIMGGSGGPQIYFTDAWLLTMKGDLWTWTQIEVLQYENSPINMWCNPACKVGDKLIVLSRNRLNSMPIIMYIKKVWRTPKENFSDPSQRNQHRIDLAQRQVDRDDNVNGKRGTLKGIKRNNSDGTCDVEDEARPGPSGLSNRSPNENPLSLAAFNTDNKQQLSTAESRRQKRYDKIMKAEEKWKKSHKSFEQSIQMTSKPRRNVLGMYVLDISHTLDDKPYVTWLPIKNDGIRTEGPDETILYTLVKGKSELIMFGGIHKDANSLACMTNLSNQVSNSVHFITAPRYVI